MQFSNNFYPTSLSFYSTGQETFFQPFYAPFSLFLYDKSVYQNPIVNQEEQKQLDPSQKNDTRTFQVEKLIKQKEKISMRTQCDQDSEYEPQKTQILNFYKKKNTESNIINQVFSFLSSQKSQSIMMKILDSSQEQVNKFYLIMKKIKKYNKRYMNRNYILDLLKLEENGVNHKILIKNKINFDLSKLRKTLRIIIKYFFSQQCLIGLLTSKKMNKSTLRQHFIRKREVQEFLNSSIFHKQCKSDI